MESAFEKIFYTLWRKCNVDVDTHRVLVENDGNADTEHHCGEIRKSQICISGYKITPMAEMQNRRASPQYIFQNGGEGRCEAPLRRNPRITNLHWGKFFTPFGANPNGTCISTRY